MKRSQRYRFPRIALLWSIAVAASLSMDVNADPDPPRDAAANEITSSETADAADPDQTGASEAEPDAPECENCPFPSGLIGSVELGIGVVSEDFFEFGNFRGLEDDGPFVGAGVDAIYRQPDGDFIDVYGERLGLESRSLSVEGGRQGSYRLTLSYNEIPHFRAAGTSTPFLGAGTASQSLPPDWVRADTTARMTALDDSLRNIEIGREHRTLGLGLEIERESPWQYHLDIRRRVQEGTRMQGGSFIFRSTQLAIPVDHETTDLETRISYLGDTWHLQAQYRLSLFDNAVTATRWSNPFSGINGADAGELSQLPDNQYHQVSLSGSWVLPGWLSVTAHLALGRGDQDETFLAPTLNAGLEVPALPRSNLDGQINTRLGNLRVTADLTNDLQARLRFDYNERDNDTPLDEFPQVLTDTFLTESRINKALGWERVRGRAALDYDPWSWLEITGAVELEKRDYTFLEVDETETDQYDLAFRIQPLSSLDVRVDLSHEERDNDIDPALLGSDVNPGLRRFNFAEKNRDALRSEVNYAITPKLATGIYYEIADEEFNDTQIGLSEARDTAYGLDLSFSPSRTFAAHGFVSFESLEADLQGVDNITGAPWQARQEDDFRTVGLSLRFDELPGKWLNAGVDFTYASADGEISIEKQRVDAPDFPELQTRQYTVDAHVGRQIHKNMDLRFEYLVGRLRENDFFRDGVNPATVDTLLSLGEGTPDDTVHVFSLLLRYHFR